MKSKINKIGDIEERQSKNYQFRKIKNSAENRTLWKRFSRKYTKYILFTKYIQYTYNEYIYIIYITQYI